MERKNFENMIKNMHSTDFVEEKVKMKERCQNYKIVLESQTGKKLLELQICSGPASTEEIGKS